MIKTEEGDEHPPTHFCGAWSTYLYLYCYLPQPRMLCSWLVLCVSFFATVGL